MRKLIFAKNINGTDETGLIDIAKNPPELFCLCEEDKANESLNLNKAPVSGSLPYPKVSKLLSALNDIRNWDDDLEDKWEDPGYRAKAALAEYYEGNDR